MGAIIFWTIIRTAVLIPLLWVVFDYFDYKFWFTMSLISLYGVIVHPAVIQYKLFMERNREIIHNTLCSSCKYFDETAVLCLKYDKHPTLDELPCEGADWEPVEKNRKEHKEFN